MLKIYQSHSYEAKQINTEEQTNLVLNFQLFFVIIQSLYQSQDQLIGVQLNTYEDYFMIKVQIDPVQISVELTENTRAREHIIYRGQNTASHFHEIISSYLNRKFNIAK
eukprot:403345693